MSVQGECICGAVSYTVRSEPKAVVNCHCNFCRSHSGAAFASYLVVPENAMEISRGADRVAVYTIKEGAHKHFCASCGTPIYNRNARYAGMCMVYLGTAGNPAGFTPTANIYCESRLSWVQRISEIREFPRGIARKTGAEAA